MKMIRQRATGFSLVLTLLFGALAVADEARELTWDDLVPPSKTPELEPGFGPGNTGGFSPAPTGIVPTLDGVQAKIPGFVVPLELADGGKIKEFLLVPYFGACIHYPPPPPNQIVYVILDEPVEVESTWEPIWVTGELKTEFRGSSLGAAGYTMRADQIEVYEY